FATTTRPTIVHAAAASRHHAPREASSKAVAASPCAGSAVPTCALVGIIRTRRSLARFRSKNVHGRNPQTEIPDRSGCRRGSRRLPPESRLFWPFVHFYLDHPADRRRIVEMGRQKYTYSRWARTVRELYERIRRS